MEIIYGDICNLEVDTIVNARDIWEIYCVGM